MVKGVVLAVVSAEVPIAVVTQVLVVVVFVGPSVVVVVTWKLVDQMMSVGVCGEPLLGASPEKFLH